MKVSVLCGLVKRLDNADSVFLFSVAGLFVPVALSSFPYNGRFAGRASMLLMVDNYDSFTYNIVQYFLELGETVEVVRNDEIALSDVYDLKPQRIVISPGPCTPTEAGISIDLIKEFASCIPILGICLGHQCIGEAFGGRIVRASQVMHGKTSTIWHEGKGIFARLPNHFRATRYHSLVIDSSTLPSSLEVTALAKNSVGDTWEIMGVQHQYLPVHGIQFHPESILSECGHALFQNFLTIPEATWK